MINWETPWIFGTAENQGICRYFRFLLGIAEKSSFLGIAEKQRIYLNALPFAMINWETLEFLVLLKIKEFAGISGFCLE